MYTIKREYVGTITENGEAFCFGVALHEDTLVYLDIAGLVETIKTICGKLVSKGRLCYLNPPQGRTIYLNPTGPKTVDVHRKKIAYGLVHCMLLHTSINQPLYGELSKTYIIHGDEGQAIQRRGHHVHQLLFMPGAGKILDPCTGEGTALEYLAQAWSMTPYGNELNQERYEQCRQRFGALQAVQGG